MRCKEDLESEDQLSHQRLSSVVGTRAVHWKMEADPDATCELLYGLFGTKTTTALPERPTGGVQTTLAEAVIAGDTSI
ncbi:MAG: hypothetical protein R2883_03340 [Caldisericia bacterium]